MIEVDSWHRRMGHRCKFIYSSLMTNVAYVLGKLYILSAAITSLPRGALCGKSRLFSLFVLGRSGRGDGSTNRCKTLCVSFRTSLRRELGDLFSTETRDVHIPVTLEM